MFSKNQKHRQSAFSTDTQHKTVLAEADRPTVQQPSRGVTGNLLALQRAIGNRAVGQLLAGGVQRLHSNDYQRAQLNANGRTDMQNVVDGITAAIRGNLAGLDENGYWQHITDRNHNAKPVVGNDSSFGGEQQATIRGYIDYVLNNYTPVLQDEQLIYDGVGAICNGIHRDGARRGVRVILNVADVSDEVDWADQIGFIRIVNAYPI